MSSKLVQLGIVVALVVAAVGGALAARLVSTARLDQNRAHRLDEATGRVQDALSDRNIYLNEVADMVGVHDDADVDEFSRYAAVLRANDEAVIAVQWLRRAPDGRLAPPAGVGHNPILVAPTDQGNATLADAAHYSTAEDAIKRASRAKEEGTSQPVALANGHAGFYLAVPIVAHRFSGDVSRIEWRSSIVGLIDAQVLVTQSAGTDPAPLEIREGVARIAAIGPAPSNPVTDQIRVAGQRWSVSVDGGSLSPLEIALPWLLLAFGLGLAATVWVVLRSTTRRRDDAERLASDRSEELERRSREDSLTGLFNRRHFSEVLAKELDSSDVKRGPAVMLIDLDNFKQVNDDYGHLTGDVALQVAAKRIARVLRGSECLARWGGEEFAVLVPEISRGDVGVLADRVRRALADEPIKVDAVTLELTLSIGVALSGDGLRTPDTLVHAADQALYEAKRAGRDCARLWGPMAKPQPLAGLR